jgi:hypothetical protein
MSIFVLAAALLCALALCSLPVAFVVFVVSGTVVAVTFDSMLVSGFVMWKGNNT